MKKIVISIIVLIAVFALVYNIISTGFFNLDYVGQGRLNSVTIHDRGCETSICEYENWEMTVTSPDQLKLLEKAFFNKFLDPFHLTKEDGSIIFIFHYDKKDIEFHGGPNSDFSGGRIYYTDRQELYYFNKNDMAIFKALFSFKDR